MNLYFIRHGRQSSKLCNVNVSLSLEGFRQSALLGERLARTGIDLLYSSDLLRAIETAESANLYWNVPHRIEPDLREISFGDMEGLSDEEIHEQFFAFRKKKDLMLEDLAYPNGESAEDVVNRAMPVIERIVAGEEKNVAIVTHGGVIRSLVASFLGLPYERSRLLGNSIENCGITKVCYEKQKQRFTLEYFNDYSHLEPHQELLRKNWMD